MALVPCPECGNGVSTAADDCPSCGHPIAALFEAVAARGPRRRWSRGVAALLSLFIPGAGQIYKGQFFNGLAWMFIVAVGYVFLIIPGLFLHTCCVLGAAMGNTNR